MPSAMPLLRAATALAVAAVLLALAGVAGAAPVKRASGDRAPFATSGGDAGGDSSFSGDAQHGGTSGHLPGTSLNVQRVGKLELKGKFGNVEAGQIADLSVYKDFAYLNSWTTETCDRGGTFVADIRDPKRPKEVGFIPALADNYHGEGAQVISASTKSFTGDLLAVNNEICTGKTPARGGGFDLYDVSDPTNPKILVQGFGDFGAEGKLTGNDTRSKEYHSVFLWKDDGNVYLVASDDEELHDVDIFDVSNPRNPKPVAEYDMAEQFPQILETPPPYGDLVLNHDMVVKEIGGRDVLLDSYWDGGYLQIDIENPTKPIYMGDTDFGGGNLVDGFDPLVPGITPPEGNAHQAEFSFDNRYFLAADEDFNPYRADKFFIDLGTGNQERPAAEVGGGTSVAALPDQTLSGTVVYGGYGCPADPTTLPKAADYPTPPAGDEKILVMQRGPSGDPSADYNGNGDLTDDACFPGEKAAKAFDAGWDAIVLVNRHLGTAGADEPFCGSGGYDPAKPMVTVCTTHTAYHELFGSTPDYSLPYSSSDAPKIGDVSKGRVTATSKFDGWGYAHLYERSNGKIKRVDSYAIPEALDPAYAFGYGDLSIHEFATDPNRNLAYSAYYAGGMRVFKYGPGGLDEVGRYIDSQGSNFWGVETFVPGSTQAGNLKGKQLFAGSDRDSGLWIFRYTGG